MRLAHLNSEYLLDQKIALRAPEEVPFCEIHTHMRTRSEPGTLRHWWVCCPAVPGSTRLEIKIPLCSQSVFLVRIFGILDVS